MKEINSRRTVTVCVVLMMIGALVLFWREHDARQEAQAALGAAQQNATAATAARNALRSQCSAGNQRSCRELTGLPEVVEAAEPNRVVTAGEQEPEIQEPEVQEPEVQQPETQDAETQQDEAQDPEIQNPEIQEPDTYCATDPTRCQGKPGIDGTNGTNGTNGEDGAGAKACADAPAGYVCQGEYDALAQRITALEQQITERPTLTAVQDMIRALGCTVSLLGVPGNGTTDCQITGKP